MAADEKQQGRWWVLASIGVGTFMSALDGSVVNTVIPVLRTDLHASVSQIEWVASIYLLVVSALLLGVGRAGDLRGQKRMYVSGFVIFVIGSALCGAALSATMLVAMRALQAIGAAMLYANSPAILTRTFSPAERGRALGAQATFTYVGLTAGPSLGGWLAHVFGWRSVFYINIPVGIVGIFMALRFIADDRPAGRSEPFDLKGALLFGASLVTLLVAFNQAPTWGWGAPLTIAAFALAIAGLLAFVALELRTHAPMLDTTLFRSATFSASATSALLNYVVLYSVLFLIPFLLIQGRGLDTQHAGLLLTAQPIVMAIVAPLSGTLSDRIGSRLLATTGMLILAGGVFGLAALAATGSLHAIALTLAVVGLGTGLFVTPNNSSMMGSAPRNRQGIASGVLATARNLGMALGIAIAGAVFDSYYTGGGHTHPALVAGVHAGLIVAGIAALLASVAAAFTSRGATA